MSTAIEESPQSAPALSKKDGAPQRQTRPLSLIVRAGFVVMVLVAIVMIPLVGMRDGGTSARATSPRAVSVWPANAAERKLQADGVRARNERVLAVWILHNTIQANNFKAWIEKAAAIEAAKRPRPSSNSATVNHNGCGGLEACRACVTEVESATSGLYSAYNSSSAAGRYQVKQQTWAGFGGYASALDAPPEVQDAWFNQAYERYHGQAEWRQLYSNGC